MQAVFILKHLLKKNIFSYYGGLYALCEETVTQAAVKAAFAG